jgi:hypothetical protein
MLDLTITRVSRSSPTIFATKDLRILDFTNIMPFGETATRYRAVRKARAVFEHWELTCDVIFEQLK